MGLFSARAYDGTSIDVSISDMIGNVIGIESVSGGTSLEVRKVKGAGNAYRGYTNGIIEALPGTVDLWVTEVARWIDAVGGVDNFHTHEFDVTITYRAEADLPLNTVVFRRCRATNMSFNHSTSSSENQLASVEFEVLDIEVNGLGIVGRVVEELTGLARNLGAPIPDFL